MICAGSPGCGQPGQDAVLVVKRPQDGVCPPKSFNSGARSPSDCLQCFCFGITDECSSTELFSSKVDVTRLTLVPVINFEPNFASNDLRNYLRGSSFAVPRGVRVQGQAYVGFPRSDLGNQLKSYGGYLRYSLEFRGSPQPYNDGADVILLVRILIFPCLVSHIFSNLGIFQGNRIKLVHTIRNNLRPGGVANEVEVRFWYGEWHKDSPRGPLASRQEILMALENLDYIVIK